MEETISLKELMQTLRKRMNLIVLITLAAVVISGAVSFFVLTPIYQSSTQLLVNQEKSDQPVYNPAEIQTNLQLINTYNVIMKSPAILDKVIDDLGLDMSVGQLNEKITVQSEKDSQVVNVTVQDPSPNQAADIANKIAEVFQAEIGNIMNVNNVSILTKAEVGENASPVKPQPVLNITIALVVGVMVGVGVAFLLEYLDNTIKTEQDIEKLLELPVLGAIATFEDQEIRRSARTPQKTRVRSESVG
ncbi:YveK family protein [Lederbergia lenta]|uniref:Lipopolysaccharide biosynthesis protein n=1 Tax=Lederbergia lenta TaxID=1467 RepID=A0A2X4WFJ0_LEDLE|nr:Wzz/FepE/Etk N-terminal domain-containing protein [Lederbergia lenta]MEC2323162.1 Wzz/FepE/Etk N-terminal domain-containing protein [Lederbergia lenta]SQI62846.1 lipopolysaccharide biosynthesis protein [Lederbergia lenta]